MPPCKESNINQSVFVQAVLFDPDTKTLAVYDPLVTDFGTTPAAPITTPMMSPDVTIGYFGGSNDDMTIINGSDCDMTTGQVFFCGTRELFAAINASGMKIPPLGLANDGTPCPTVRDFRIVDQDPSDNVQTSYLLFPGGQTAQNTATNRGKLSNYTVIVNPSDNRVLSLAVDSAIGCKPWLLPDVTDFMNVVNVPSQAADELQAAMYQLQPIAYIPSGDPMTGPNVLAVLDAYRLDVDQPIVTSVSQASTLEYCRQMTMIQTAFIQGNIVQFNEIPSPLPGFTSLYAFLFNRLAQSRAILKCAMLGV